MEVNTVSKNNRLTFNSSKHDTKRLEEMNIHNVMEE